MSKLRKALPRQSPRRYSIIVRKLAETMGLMEPESNMPSNNKISEEKTKLVKELYVRDVSRQTPGLKDYLTVWGDKGNEASSLQYL